MLESFAESLAILNGFCTRFIETIKLECLNRFVVFGKQHLDYLTREFTCPRS
ncbi:hypothetical protein [Stratiformator vulcanicus]|uniref:Uncharacterized protein n=1 Tax=Stratiformator vulcanicus TaxID=2527980 RepID=A0A517QWB0_9PLAN|nr:hypothetical protein [Stratiformator vulcanicus]QDT35955.1 hypothetical protein Pan189_03100 [Stratiformator vulcanicus]